MTQTILNLPATMTADPEPAAPVASQGEPAGRAYECCPCQETYLAGAHSGPGPFACGVCGRTLTLRPDGAEPYGVEVCRVCPAWEVLLERRVSDAH